MTPSWTPAIALESLHEDQPALLKRGQARVALFRVDDAVYAIDDRCPHEGYPLIQGEVCGTTLTCCFHNFKFDLPSGHCLMGDEAVRTYPTRVVDGQIEVDLSPQDPAVVRERLWRSLRGAMAERKTGQIARDTTRLLQAGEDPVALAVFAATWDAVHAEYGTTHALPVAADVLHWLPHYPGLQAALPLVQALEISADLNIRRPPREVPEPIPPGDPQTFASRLRGAVEREDTVQAEALIRGALAAGWQRAVIEPALMGICADHFLDYGHALIYVIKAVDLCEAAGWSHAEALLPSLVYSATVGTREDTLPAWSGWRRRMDERLPRLRALAEGSGDVADPAGLQAVLLDGRGSEAEAAVETALSDGASLQSVARVLCVAAAIRLHRFDGALDLDPGLQDNWLSVTHVQTFCNAVRHAVERWASEGAVRLVFQAVRMISMTRPLDAVPRPDGIPELQEDLAELRKHWMDVVIRDPATRSIVVAHAIKQVIAAFDDADATGRTEPIAALVRFLEAPKQERRVARITSEAIALVADGRVPRRRVP